MVQMEAHRLSFLQCIAVAREDLFLVDENIPTFLVSDKAKAFAWVEPLELALPLGHRAGSQETGHTTHGNFDLYPSTCKKVKVGRGGNKTASTSLAYDSLGRIRHNCYLPSERYFFWRNTNKRCNRFLSALLTG
jgi:hypothetical protein